MEIKLGSFAQDRISGFEGVVTAKTIYITGCVRYAIEPRGLDKEGKPQEAQWFDAVRLVVNELQTPLTFAPQETAAAPGGGANPPYER